MNKADLHKALADIVGPEYVVSSDIHMEAYAIWYNSASLNADGSVWTPRPAAVVLPKTAQEISRIYKLCNSCDYQVKPFSTGWIATCAAGSERTVMLDLSRMDRIIDIDIKNQIAVIEPYVKAGILQHELMKVGLNVHIVSAGANHSTLASVTSAWGYGSTGPSMSFQSRNFLGAEWVMPDGQIQVFGSGGEGGKWFSADGPGPSTRGAIRGFFGTMGGMGTFTKAAVKLYRWDGDKKPETTGASPVFTLKDDLPPNMRCYMLVWPSNKESADAGYLMGEADLQYAEFRIPGYFAVMGLTDNNRQFVDIWETGLFQKVGRATMVTFMSGHSQAEFDWKEKALRQILKETHGLSIPIYYPGLAVLKAIKPIVAMINDPVSLMSKIPLIQSLLDSAPMDPVQARRYTAQSYLALVPNATNTQSTFRVGTLFTTLGAFDTWDNGIAQTEWLAKNKKQFTDAGLLVQDGDDTGVGGTFEAGHMGYLEGICTYQSDVPASVQAARKLAEAGIQAAINVPFGMPIGAVGAVGNAVMGPHCSNYHEWIAKIQKAFDPESASDSWTYCGDAGEKRMF